MSEENKHLFKKNKIKMKPVTSFNSVKAKLNHLKSNIIYKKIG